MKTRNRMIAIAVGAALLVSLILFSMTYSVRFNEVVVVTTFGEAASASAVQSRPGLHLKLPAPIQATKEYDTRLQHVDTRLDTQATKDGLLVVMQAFVLWRIDASSPEAVLRFNDTHGSLEDARNHIELRLRSGVSALSQYEFNELIGANNKLAEAEAAIQARMEARGAGQDRSLADMGIRIERVGISQVLLPVGTTRNVIERMQSQRQNRAEGVRNQGASAATQIENDAAAKSSRIIDHAERLAKAIRGKGDELAQSAVAAMSIDPEFAIFLIALDGLERSTTGTSTILVPPVGSPFDLLHKEGLASYFPNLTVRPARAESGEAARIASDGQGDVTPPAPGTPAETNPRTGN